jgi:hypothetical protein
MTIEAVSCSHSGCVDLRDSRYPDDDVLHLSAEEWAEFLAAVKREASTISPGQARRSEICPHSGTFDPERRPGQGHSMMPLAPGLPSFTPAQGH